MHKMLSLAVSASVISLYVLFASLRSHAQNAVVENKDVKIHAGNEVFNHNCLQCHAVIEGQYSFGPNLSGEMRKPRPKKSAAEIHEILQNGKGKMPPFKDKLTDPDTDALMAYLRTL